MFEQNEWARNDRAMPDPFEIYDKLLDLQEDLKKCQRDLEEHKRISELRFSSLERWQGRLAQRPSTADALGGALSHVFAILFGAVLGVLGTLFAFDKLHTKDWEKESSIHIEPIPPSPPKEVIQQLYPNAHKVQPLKQVDSNEEK